MKIGIDAWLLAEKTIGIGRYIEELTVKLVKKSNNEFYLYSARPIVSKIRQQSNIKLRSKNFHSRLMRLIWSQTYLSYWASQDTDWIFSGVQLIGYHSFYRTIWPAFSLFMIWSGNMPVKPCAQSTDIWKKS